MEKLSQLARITYLKLCYAGLQEDMAQRIMFSILPHLADSSQVAMTQGVVDTRALKAAVEGRKNIIKYAVKAVLNELNNYGRLVSVKKDGPSPHDIVATLLDNNEPEKAMDVAVETFRDLDGWASQYGGRAWEMIAKTIRQIIRLDRQLGIIRQQSPSPDNQAQEVQVMRDLIVEMNVFDGLAHNSDSIMHNMIALETAETIKDPDPKQLSEKRKENYLQIKRLMDAKELEDPNEVFKQLRDTLTHSGDINKFKDWVAKMRGKKEFFQSDPKLTEKLFMIYIRKALISARGEFNSLRDTITKLIGKLEQEWRDEDFFNLYGKLNWATGEIVIAAEEFAEHKKHFFKQYPELIDGQATVDAILEKPSIKAFKLLEHFKKITQPLDLMRDAIPESERIKFLGIGKEALSILNHFSYLLDSI